MYTFERHRRKSIDALLCERCFQSMVSHGRQIPYTNVAAAVFFIQPIIPGVQLRAVSVMREGQRIICFHHGSSQFQKHFRPLCRECRIVRQIMSFKRIIRKIVQICSAYHVTLKLPVALSHCADLAALRPCVQTIKAGHAFIACAFGCQGQIVLFRPVQTGKAAFHIRRIELMSGIRFFPQDEQLTFPLNPQGKGGCSAYHISWDTGL